MSTFEERFPRLAAYLAALPNGLDSFAECRAKASLLHYAQRRVPPTFDLGLLPPRLAAHLGPRLTATWIGEVEYTAATLALWDGRRLDDDAACATWYGLVKDLRTSPLYRVIMSLVSPGRMMRGAPLTWQQFHRGTTIRIADETKRSTVLELTSPAGLFSPLVLRAYGSAFQAAVEPKITDDDPRPVKWEALPGRARYMLEY